MSSAIGAAPSGRADTRPARAQQGRGLNRHGQPPPNRAAATLPARIVRSRSDGARRGPYLVLNALLTRREVMSTIWIMRS